MTIAQLRKAAVEWQATLGLTDWKIAVRFPKRGEMSAEFAGHTYWKPEYPEGLIILRRRGACLHDLVHELLHIRLEGHRPQPKRYDALYERALNTLTEALLQEPEPGSITIEEAI